MEKPRRCDWESQLLFRITILCKCFCMSLRDSPLQPANGVRIGGISTLVGQRTRSIVREILSDDGRTDREACGQVYKVRDCLRRGGFCYIGPPI